VADWEVKGEGRELMVVDGDDDGCWDDVEITTPREMLLLEEMEVVVADVVIGVERNAGGQI